MTNSYSTKGTPSLEQLTNVVVENPINNEAVLYEDGVWKNKAVLTPSSLPSGSDGDVIVSDGAGGIVSRNALSVNNVGHLSGFVANINGSDIKLGSSAGSFSGTDNISIGFGAGNSSGNSAVSIGTSAGTFGGDNSVSIGKNARADDDNCIVINATGSLLDSGITSSCYIAPVRDINAISALDPYVIQYDDLTKEMFKSVNLHTQHIECVDINNTGTLTNVGTASLWNGQLTIGGSKVVAGAGNNNLVVDLTNQKVAINKATPDEQLDINGTLRIEADATQTIRFYDTQGGGSPDEDGRIEVAQDSGGGQMKFYTLQTGGGTPQERLTINRYGALGLTTNYGSSGQFLKSNGIGSPVSWDTPTDTTYTQGTGISIVGTTINNTAPDQTVTLTPGTDINITGTYPNFTINSTASSGSTFTTINVDTIVPNTSNVLKLHTDPTTQIIEVKTAQLYPQTDNATILGGSGNRWSKAYIVDLYAAAVRTSLNPPYNAGAQSPNLYLGANSSNRWFGAHMFYLYYNSGGLASDDRLKHNEVNVSNGLNIIRQLTPKKYKKSMKMYPADYNGEIEGIWNWETGLIAQEVMALPDLSFCVTGGDRTDEDTGELIEETHHVDYNSIFTYNISATKELDAIVQQQAQLISSLEARILALESK